MKRLYHLTLLVLLFSVLRVSAQTLLPLPHNMVNDSAHLFSSEENTRIEHLLRAYRNSTTREIVIVTVNNFKGYDANSFATELGNQWGIGQRDVNNGIIVLLRPGRMPAIPLSSSVDAEWESARNAYFTEEHSYFLYSFLNTLSDDSIYMESKMTRPEGDYGEGYIATGRGMESALPDVLAARIMRNVVAPFFAAHRYAVGTEAGLYAIFESLEGDATTVSEVLGYQEQGQENKLETVLALLICYILLSLIWAFFSILFQSIGHAVHYFSSKDLRSQHSFISYWRRESWLTTKRVLRRLPSHMAMLLLFILSHLSSGSSNSSHGSRRSSFSGGGGSFGGGGGGSRF